jgi:hypothetical protein
MSEGVMNAGLFTSPELATPAERGDARRAVSSLRPAAGWTPENFAQEQIRGLVRKVFFSVSERPVRQVVFGAVEPETEALSICRSVGEALALETQGSVCIAGAFPEVPRIGRCSTSE